MAAVAGILFTDAMGLPKWYEAGGLEYGIPPLAQLAILAPVMGFLETKRLEGWLATGQSGLVSTFPFDPMGQNGPDKATKEVKNGRLAMVRGVAWPKGGGGGPWAPPHAAHG
jgi:light-harvesting complex I chlorophyll a/b binding protein 5